MKIKLLPHQIEILNSTAKHKRVGYFLGMSCGKTFISSEKANSLNVDILIVCPKSIILMWTDHFEKYYPKYARFDLTKPKEYTAFFQYKKKKVGFINYDLVWRRPELSTLKNYTLLLDESSFIKNETTRRAKFILNQMKPDNVILCSGTAASGRYENLFSQLRLLGWNVSKKAFWNRYINYYTDTRQGFPITYVYGYKNVQELKQRIYEYGGRFLKTEDVLTLPEQIFTTIKCKTTPKYLKFQKTGIVTLDGVELVGDTVLTKLLYMRMLCGHYNPSKVEALKDLVRSTSDRLIVFYNFTAELDIIKEVARAEDKPLSVISGGEKNLEAYEKYENSITAINFQAGSHGLNLQKVSVMVFFTPTLSVENYMQSQKRIHRYGQKKTCSYYFLVCENSVEEKIYSSLERGQDYELELFKNDFLTEE